MFFIFSSLGEPPKDRRGQHTNRPHKLTDEMVQKIRDHISSFRGRQPHYSQDKTRRLYLSEDLNIKEMFNMFQIIYPDSKISYETYRTIFNNDFNIAFGYPRTDTCSKCDELKMRIDLIAKDNLMNPDLQAKLKELETERDLHQRKAETFHRRKRESRIKAINDSTFEAIAFDYQRNLNVPINSINGFYYRRKLSLLSLAIDKHIFAQ